MALRWITGFFKWLVRLWDHTEWFYYAKSGIDPKLPASDRWDVYIKTADKAQESDDERMLPKQNRWVMLKDKYMQSQDEVLFFTTDGDKVNALAQEYKKELRTRTSGDFYYRMIVNRNLDFFHNYHVEDEELAEGMEADRQRFQG